MTSNAQTGSGGGMIAKIAVLVLLALTLFLYLRIIWQDNDDLARTATSQASVRVVESGAQSPTPNDGLRDLPEDQMRQIIEVFAPELREN